VQSLSKKTCSHLNVNWESVFLTTLRANQELPCVEGYCSDCRGMVYASSVIDKVNPTPDMSFALAAVTLKCWDADCNVLPRADVLCLERRGRHSQRTL
jgi:hypothetical protein